MITLLTLIKIFDRHKSNHPLNSAINLSSSLSLKTNNMVVLPVDKSFEFRLLSYRTHDILIPLRVALFEPASRRCQGGYQPKI